MQTILKDNSSFFERLMYYADLQGIKNPHELAKRLGYPSAEKLYRLDRKVNAKPSADIITDISNLFEHLNLRWLLSGKGSITIPINDNSSISIEEDKSSVVSENDNTHYSNLENATSANQKGSFQAPKVVTVDSKGKNNIALVSVRDRAGYLQGYKNPEYIAELPVYNVPKLDNGIFRAFEIEGLSMVPTINHGDIVFAQFVQDFAHITDDGIYVVVTAHDGVLVKRLINNIDKYGFITAKSDSIDNRSNYPNLKIAPDQIVEIWEAKMFMSSDFSSPQDIYSRINALETEIEHFKSKKEQK